MSASATTFIYALLDPRTGAIRYVGKADDPQKRLGDHLRQCKCGESYRAHWLRQLLRDGLRPLLEVVDEVAQSEWAAVECAYVTFYKEQGCELVNATPGGDGMGAGELHPLFGRPRSPEVRAKLSAANKGKTLSPEVRAKLRAAHNGKIFSPERCANMSAAQKGKPASAAKLVKLKALHAANRGRRPTPEQTARKVAAQTGRKHSPETIAKMRATGAGRKPSEATRLANRRPGLIRMWERRRQEATLAEMWN